MPSLATYDPPVPLDDLKAARDQCFQSPIADSEGRVFQFDEASERMMERAILALEADTSLTINWRLLDNTEVPVDHTTLPGILADLRLRQSQRGITIDQEYMNFKLNGVTESQLLSWVIQYSIT